MSLQSIVCHVDLSNRSRAGARLACAIADRHDASLVLVHADDLPSHSTLIGLTSLRGPTRVANRVALDHERMLRKELASLSEQLERVTAVPSSCQVLRDGSVDGFLDFAAAVNPDLIVVGADEPSVVRRVLHRSVTESVARRAPCPVLALAKGSDVHLPLAHVLVAVDYSPQSRVAAEIAAQLVGERGAISFVHVWTTQALTNQKFPGAGALYQLRQFTNGVGANAADIALYIERGDPATGIARRAQELGVDLIVVGSHPHVGWRDRLFGTMTDRVLERAQCPVLAVPAGAGPPRAKLREVQPEQSSIDQTLADSFPASDPPSWWAGPIGS